MSKKTVTPCYGKPFEVDTSDEAISKLELGFKHGDRIKHPFSGEGTVIGVAPGTEGIDPEPDVLWCAFDENGGEIVEYSYPFLLKPV